jgi:trehalose/maltose hydrolase-like predicted phosphorylase
VRSIPLVLCLCAGSLLAQPDTFQMTIASPSPYTRTYIGNGNLGVSTSPLGTEPVESFLSGLYDGAEGDVPHIAALPAWNEVNFFNGKTWLNAASPDGGSLRDYRQTLNMRDGTVRTQYRWTDQGRATSVLVEMFVSRPNANLAAVKFEITPHYSGPVRVALSLRGWPPPKRLPLAIQSHLAPTVTQHEEWYPGYMVVDHRFADADQKGGQLRVISHPEGVADSVGEVAELAWPADLAKLAVKKVASGDLASVELGFDATAEKTYVFYKYVAVVRSAKAEHAMEKASRIGQSARSRGYDAVAQESAGEWHRLWQTDIVVNSTPEFQTLVHSMLFYLLCSARADSDYSIPPMGLSTAGYYGHVFWDSDTYMFPPLMVLHPEMAKPIVMFRCRTLETAKANARKNGWKGAMYPWEAGPDGSETTPRFAWQNATSEIHVTGDVALAQWQYYLATGDRQWLAKYGYPVIKETADFWASRVTYNNEKDRYEIRNVVSYVESIIGADNDPYTNAVAAKNLDLAIAAAKALGEAPNPEWDKIRHKLYLPAGATLLVSYPLGRSVSEAAKRKELENALERFRAGYFGAMMGITFNPILAAEANAPKLLDKLLPYTYEPYLMPAFNVLREVPSNDNINFLTGAGGFLQQFIFGYTGMRFSEEGLVPKFDPLLPHSVRKMMLKNITMRGGKRDLVYGGDYGAGG